MVLGRRCTKRASLQDEKGVSLENRLDHLGQMVPSSNDYKSNQWYCTRGPSSMFWALVLLSQH
jgi:hypothetical protein